jgi:hypothetical protein
MFVAGRKPIDIHSEKREKKVTKIWLALNHGDRLRIGDVSPPDLAIEESISAPP